MLTRQNIEAIAKLARLKLSEQEIETYTQQIGHILEHIEKLNLLDTTGIEATSHAVELPTPLRDDEAKVSTAAQAILEIAPSRDDQFFSVPKVL